jgi:Zinc finger, C2H2 type
MSFKCDKCGRCFERKIYLTSHLNRKIPCTVSLQESFVCDICDKEYSNRNSLCKHKSRGCNNKLDNNNDAKKLMKETSSIYDILLKQQQELFELRTEKDAEKKEREELKKMLKNNLKENVKLNEITNTNNSTTNQSHNNTQTNSHNTQSNNHNNALTNTNNINLIQYVTNNYPNAKNIEDCVNLNNISSKLLDDCYDMYFLEGTMHIIKQLCNIGEEHRPFHCTDASRGNYIYKTNDVWKIDVGGEEIKSHIIPVINSTYRDVHSKRIANNPNSNNTMASMCFEMTHDNVKKTCGKALKKVTTNFIAKNIKRVGASSQLVSLA